MYHFRLTKGPVLHIRFEFLPDGCIEGVVHVRVDEFRLCVLIQMALHVPDLWEPAAEWQGTHQGDEHSAAQSDELGLLEDAQGVEDASSEVLQSVSTETSDAVVAVDEGD